MHSRVLLAISIAVICIPALVAGAHAQEYQERSLHTFEHRGAASSDLETREFDVLRYRLNLRVDPDQKRIGGNAVVTVRSTADGVEAVSLDLRDRVTVTGVEADGAALVYDHHAHTLDITLPRVLDAGGEVTVRIAYDAPIAGSLQQAPFVIEYHDGQPVIYNFSGAPYWFPCNDDASDKATAELDITVPAGLVVASNGTLVEKVVAGNETTYRWREDYPVSTYLMSIAITNYEVIEDVYVTADGDSVPLVYYVYPEHAGGALAKFGVTPRMLEVFASIYGEYPFAGEKYGMAEVPIGVAGMEHQTMTSIGDGVIPSPHDKDWLIAHELAHQWWGDTVTLEDWVHLWLNEGFASYAEAQWFEATQGMQAYHDHMALFESRVVPGTLYDPEQPFSGNAYYKGAWVLHMLRHVVGEESFAEILPAYASEFAYANATTGDFQAVCERVSGMDLEWFFGRWIYGYDRPSYEYSWYAMPARGGSTVFLTIRQVQSAGIFEMPIDIRVTTSAGGQTFVVRNDREVQHYALAVDGDATVLEFDPGNWILHFAEEVPAPMQAALDIMPGTCVNPFNRTVFEKDPMHNPDAMRGGVVKVALLGDDRLEVSRVDMTAVALEGVSPLRHRVADIAGPADGGEACPEPGPDGNADILLTFAARDIAAAMGPASGGDTVVLTLTGELDNGTDFVAHDRVRLTGKTQGPQTDPSPAPGDVDLGPPVPNPFNPVTRIPYYLPRETRMTLSVYDVGGNLVERLLDRVQPPGNYVAEWNATGHASGVYFCRLRAGNASQVRRMILLK